MPFATHLISFPKGCQLRQDEEYGKLEAEEYKENQETSMME